METGGAVMSLDETESQRAPSKKHIYVKTVTELSSPPRCSLFIREPRIHAPPGIQTWNMRLNKRLGHSVSKMWFCVSPNLACEVRARINHLKQRRFAQMNE